MVRADAGEARFVLSDPATMTQRGNLLAVGNLPLTKLADVVSGSPYLLPIGSSLFGFRIVPSDLPPLQLDRLFAMRTRDVEASLVSSQIPLPDSSLGGCWSASEERFGT